MSILASVVVPTYRRPELLNRCLQALVYQNFASEAYEIIIVDDGPEDSATRELVLEWQQRMQASLTFISPPALSQIPVSGSTRQTPQGQSQTGVTYQVFSHPARCPRIGYLPAYHTQGPAAARNLGWRAAAGDIIAFTDDDTIPDPDWLARGVMAFVGNIAAVSGRVMVPLSADPTDNEINTTGLERSDFVTANCLYRRKVLEAVGGFDERFATAWREDSDLYFTVRERGYALAWAPDALVLHPVRPEAWGSSVHQQRKSFYNSLLYKKHPALYRRFIQPAPPWHYYGMLLGILAGISGLLLGNAALALAGLVIWLALLLLFIRKRLKGTAHDPKHVLEMVLTSLVIPFLSIYWRIRGALHWRVFFI